MLQRSAGVLAHITSLPGPFGIGDLGPAARALAEFLNAAGQSWWQVLPLCPPGGGNSPYGSPASGSRNPMVLSPDDLVRDELLEPTEIEKPPPATGRIDFKAATVWKMPLVLRAAERLEERRPDLLPDREAFLARRPFIHQAALFNVLHRLFPTNDWAAWPEPFRERQPHALRVMESENAEMLRRSETIQFLVYRQLQALKEFCSRRGIRFIGDVPIYVERHSADVWWNRSLFRLDESGRPTLVAGVPPDYFNLDGQLWGNPLYAWDQHKLSGYEWWINRLRNELEFAALVRVDHFRAIQAFYTVKAGSPNAKNGDWEPGPGDDFLSAILQAVGAHALIAEDLGIIDEAVRQLRDRHGLPGMAVLQFAYGEEFDPNNPHLPEHHAEHCVVYTGTHDNNTTEGWWASLTEAIRSHVRTHLKADSEPIHRVFLEATYRSRANLVITPVQDLLGLDGEARMNRPGYPDGNWGWLLPEGALTPELAERLLTLTRSSERHHRV